MHKNSLPNTNIEIPNMSISYLQRTDENFPKPIKVSEAITVWSVEELKNYFLSKPRITNAEG